MAANQGQHLRMIFGTSDFIANSLDLQFHISWTTENCTTKDTTDNSGLYEEYEKIKYGCDGSVRAIVTVVPAQGGTGLMNSMYAGDIKNAFARASMAWQLVLVGGENNRANPAVIASGSKLTLNNVQVSGPKDGYAEITASFVIYGGITVGSDS